VGKPVRVQIPLSAPSQYSKGIWLRAKFPFFVFWPRVAKKWLAGLIGQWDQVRRRQIVGMVPPSMTYSLPVIDAARSEARKATSSATSSGLPGLPTGMPPIMSMICWRAASIRSAEDKGRQHGSPRWPGCAGIAS
jgi:hypothetical protein